MIHKKLGFFALALLLASGTAFAQTDSTALRKEDPPVPAEEIIKKFAEKEKQFKDARANYVYRQDVIVQELNANDRVLGEYRLVSDILFDEKKRRTEKIVRAPQSTLTGIQVTMQDLQDIRDIQPFVLTSDDIQKYKLTYAGKEKIDELDTYVFDVEPKVIEKGQRYFQGRIWVDDIDMQIVKTYGKAVPDIRDDNGNENLFPRFETYREQIDEYWFPTYTRAVDTLNFSTGAKRIRQIIRYQNYKKFVADVKLTFGDAVEGETAGKAGTAPTSGKAPALDPKLGEKTKKKKNN
ncbi:MAG: hypothetical protein HY646_16695 [Acidobacteria bacterium]|nr:hypothetical protein [Acidobacteriota bacterium]